MPNIQQVIQKTAAHIRESLGTRRLSDPRYFHTIPFLAYASFGSGRLHQAVAVTLITLLAIWQKLGSTTLLCLWVESKRLEDSAFAVQGLWGRVCAGLRNFFRDPNKDTRIRSLPEYP